MANISLILTSISTGIIILVTVSIITLRIRTHFMCGRNTNGLYSCEDGTASEESEAQYRAATKMCALVVLIAAFVGFSITLTNAVLQLWQSSAFPAPSAAIDSWIRAVDWVLVLLLAICISLTQNPNDKYRVAICGAFCTFIIAGLSVARTVMLGFHDSITIKNNFRGSIHILSTLQLASCIVESAVGLASFIIFLSFPRRPQLYTEKGRFVDRENTVSAISHYTFQWCASILDLVESREVLALADLPSLAYAKRAKTVHQVFLSSDRGGLLWKRVLLTHLSAFLLQWSLTLLQSGIQFVTQLSMYNLLRQVELRQAGDETSNYALVIWCIALGISLLLTEWVQSWLYWIIFAQLAAPIRAQLSSLIFAKALRRKNVKALRKGTMQRKTNVDAARDRGGEGRASAATAGDDTNYDEALAKKSTQSTINLVGVDATRVADFCSTNCLLVNSVFKACISTAFLMYLIGWRALLAGIVSFTLITPFTTFITKRYSAEQKALMAVRDEKLGVVTEALQCIRQIKFAALENAWEKKISTVRERELGVLWRNFIIAALLEFVGLVGPLLLSSVSLAVYVYFNGELTPSVAFTTLAVFSSLEATVGLIPLMITELIDSKVSTSRIHDHLETSERSHNISYAEEISFTDASIAWPSDDHDQANNSDDQFVLKGINVAFCRGELNMISGKTGAGKSLLLAALTGESELLTGVIKMPRTQGWSTRYDHAVTAETWIVPGSLAFVAQIPWIENMSIKENILFSLPMDRARYETTLWACSLEHDLELLPDGDETEIGANGINLSGGQRWRVALARVLYSRAEILVLDDIFSAVDAHVGAWILDKALAGSLAQGRTRILATHHVSLVAPKARYAVVVADGTVAAAESVTDGFIESAEPSVLVEHGAQNLPPNISNNSAKEIRPLAGQVMPQAFVKEEQRKAGAISLRIFWTYFKASGGLSAWMFCLLAFLATRLTMLGRSWWVKIWTSSYSMESLMHTLSHVSRQNATVVHPFSKTLHSSNVEGLANEHLTQYYLVIYFAVGIAACLANTLKELFISTLVIKGSKNLFAAMTHTVLRMPRDWIDTVPVGRILNRFTADFNAVDSRMAHDLGSMISSAIQVLVIVVASSLVSPLVPVLSIVLLGFAVRVARRYLAAAREVKRLESVTKSPVFEQFGSVLTGLSTIRAFGNAHLYMEKMYGLIDGYTTTSWNLWLMNRWLGFNIGLIGVIATVAVAVGIVSTKYIDAALAGFALSFTLEFSVAVNWTLRRYANTELIMNAVERIHEYSELVAESTAGVEVPAAWPSEGRLLVRDLVAGYNEDSPPVLKGITFEVAPNERIGVVGRTGAGKSSLMLTLFRFLEARGGSITIDGIDISKVKLYDLRSRLSVIPQDPGLFAGTIRSNLDPFNHYDDVKLHEALGRVHLTTKTTPSSGQRSETMPTSSFTNINIFEDLSSPISEGGFNLSQGQRQLLCLARALLLQPKIMILDEATSAVDLQTDALIQRTLREEFANTTLIVIAHRLSTVADFDCILVLSDGAVEEFGSPRELMAERGAYWRMVRETGRGAASEVEVEAARG